MATPRRGAFMQELRTWRCALKPRGPWGQIITFGVAADEPPGRSLSEAKLHLVALDYVTADDWGAIKRTSPQELKWKRLERLCTQSYEQGVALSLPDLAHLLGISTDAVQNTMKKHDQVILPTRGRVADMGSTLSHAEKIVALYMDGYTETEIKRRTGHSYDSIERYLFDFSRVVCLAERGMPPAMRQALAMSRRVVTKYLNLWSVSTIRISLSAWPRSGGWWRRGSKNGGELYECCEGWSNRFAALQPEMSGCKCPI